ncbi:nuclear pore protein [Scheffersomyces stipitis CBS 6054]|uniref:Nuclear pore protein n=1 Tax=Scheffersomyces stipitis (strain ATCC 58785 / CBS 6054 / NBRC 10063 / NRRL Y-11545) TaxID=322104 RepID=A3GEU8_PICST|nr:nuclear pore protein [Scheffersomyces stipitis CBS 6054]EAZ63231.2 nuclear pore protein [Scheffersomyces stipitis CBS 6054]
MDSIEEVNTDDFGFSLATDEKGFSVFGSTIDFEVHEEPLNLLAIGNKSGIIAISNVTTLCLDTLSAVDNPEAEEAKETLLRSVAGDDLEIKQVFFSPDEQTLFVVNNNKLQKLSAKKFIAGEGSSLADYEIGVAIIKNVIPSPVHNEKFLVLDDSNTLFLWEKSSLETVGSNIASACWSRDGSSYSYIINNTTTITNSADSTHIPIDVSQDEEYESDNYHIKQIFDLKTKFIAIFESNDSELDYHTTKAYYIEKTSSGYATQKLELEPPSNTVSRHLTYYTTWISEWKRNETLFFFSSGSSTDVDSLVSDASGFKILQLEDTNRASFPIDDEADVDTSPVGMAVDLRAFEAVVKEPCSGVEEVKGKLPKVYTLLHTGKLIAWWVFDKHGVLDGTVDLQRAYSAFPAVERDISSSISVIKETPSSQSEDSTTKGTFDGSIGFGSSSTRFGSSTGANEVAGGAFGSTSGAFGNLSTSDKTPSKTAEEGPTSFGSVAFGSAAPTSQPAAFGSSPQASKPVASGIGATPAFGSVGFGAPSFGSTSFVNANSSVIPTASSKSTFSNYANTPSGFGASTAKASPFGNLTSGSGSSPFASIGSGDKESPFGKLQESKSIFGQESNEGKPSSFGSTANVESPFAKLGNLDINKDGFGEPKESPFASLAQDTKPKESPFASFAQDTKQVSPFSSLAQDKKPSDSPFSSLGQERESKESPFASLKQTTKFESPFAKLEPFKRGEKQLTELESLRKHDSAESESTIGSYVNVEGSNEPSFGDLAIIDNSDKAAFGSNKSAFGGFGGSSTKSFGSAFGSSLTTTQQAVQDSSDSDETYDSEESSQEENSQAVDVRAEEVREHSYTIAGGRGNYINDSTSYDEQIPDKSTLNKEANKLNEFMLSRGTREKIVEDSSESYEEMAQHHSGGYISDESYEDLEEEDEIEKLLANRPPANPELLKFDGLEKGIKATKNPIEDMISTIFQNTTGQLKILERNSDKIIGFIDEHDYETSYSDAALKYPDYWHLASSHNIGILAKEEIQDITAIIEQAELQETKSKKLEDEVKLLQQKRIQLDKLISHLSIISKSETDPLLKSRPLDLANEALQVSIRKKLTRVKSLERELISKMMPLKARCSVNEGIASNLEKVTLKLHSNVADQRARIDVLLKEVEELSVNEKKEIPLIEASYNTGSIKAIAKTRLSNRLKDSSKVTKVKF